MSRHALRTEPARRTPSSRPRIAVRRKHRWSELQRVALAVTLVVAHRLGRSPGQ